jgi:hypothetical protein
MKLFNMASPKFSVYIEATGSVPIFASEVGLIRRSLL